MSSPQQPPPKRQQTPAQAAAVEAENAAVDADASQLVPALLTVLAAYIAYRSAKGKITGPVSVWMKALGLEALAGKAFLQTMERALARQRERDRDANRLLPYSKSSSLVGVDTMMRQLVNALQFYQRTDANPHSTPADLRSTPPDNVGRARQGGRSFPDAANPPTGLAEMLAVSGRNAAQLEAVIEHDLDTDADKKGTSLWKNWQDLNDSHVRPSHQFLGSTSYAYHSVPAGEPFVTIHGDRMNFPGDASLGAGLDELINCRCSMTFSRKSTRTGPTKPYFPAYWIKKQAGQLPHDEMARRAAEKERWERDKARREAVYARLFGSQPSSS